MIYVQIKILICVIYLFEPVETVLLAVLVIFIFLFFKPNQLVMVFVINASCEVLLVASGSWCLIERYLLSLQNCSLSFTV